MSGAGGMLGLAFYEEFKDQYDLRASDKDVNEEWLQELDFRNYDNYLNKKFLKKNLTEVKDIFRENYQDQIIMHMNIVNDNGKDNSLYLEVNFITISNNITLIYDKILENYQIKVQKYMSGSYIKSFMNDNETKLSVMAKKLNDGFNRNEVKFARKNIENQGFFEKFFQLFS